MEHRPTIEEIKKAMENNDLSKMQKLGDELSLNVLRSEETLSKTVFGSPEEGKPKNLYNCKECGNTIITEDRDEGVTPASLSCRMFAGCKNGRMWSFGYNVPPTLVASHEWYKKGSDEALHIRKISGLRTDGRTANFGCSDMLPIIDVDCEGKRKPPTQGMTGATSIHEKFRKGKRK